MDLDIIICHQTDLHNQNAIIQENSKIPALIAANIEAGGDGGVGGGTHFGYHVAIGATQDKENAYKMGILWM